MTFIFKSCFILCYTMREFMSNYVDAFCKPLKDLSIAITIYHLGPIPKSVIVILSIVYGRV